MNDLFFIDYEAKVMLTDTLGMRPDTELAHRRLCDFIWATGEPPADNIETIQDIGRIKQQDYMRIRGELEMKGWLVENGKFTHKGTVKTMNRCIEKHAKKVAAGQAGAAGRWDATAKRPHEYLDSTALAEPKRPECQSQSQSQSVKTLPPGFDEFWKAYPRKVGKIKAQAAWKKISKPIATLPAILSAIESQKKSEQWRKENGQFIPHPTTWLNEGRWLDEAVQLNNTRPAHWPRKNDVALYAKDKGDDKGAWVSWYQYQSKKDFKNPGGMLIDWKIAIGEWLAKQR